LFIIFARLFMRSARNNMGTRESLDVTLETCVAASEKAQMILTWVRAPSVANTSHPWTQGVTRVML
jgi:hypothetical protein